MNWLTYFERNRTRRLRIPWEQGIAVELHLREPLLQSLPRFQVGESGEGRHLKQGAAATGDSDYMASIALFVAEEQEHSRLLARLIDGLGGECLGQHWTNVGFIFLRRSLGLYFELLILLIAEMIAKPYYRALRDGTSDPVLKTVCDQILRDEAGHVAFHRDTLRRVFAPCPLAIRLPIRLIWQLLFWGVCLVVLYDHRPVLRATRVTAGQFWKECNGVFDEVAARIFKPLATFRRLSKETEPLG